MTIGLHLTRMSAPESVTLSKKIHTSVTALGDSEGEEAITPQVVEAAEDLVVKAKPLSQISPSSHKQKLAIDHGTDSVLAGINNNLKAFQQTFSQKVIPLRAEAIKQRDAARELQLTLFPNGTFFLKEAWYKEYGMISIILDRAEDPKIQENMRTLKLEHSFDLLKQMYLEYGIRMGYSEVSEEAQNPAKLHDEWYSALEHYLVTVMSTHKKGSVLRNALEEPYIQLSDAIRAARRLKKKKKTDHSS